MQTSSRVGLMAAFAALALGACTGSTGPQGPAGTDGTNGSNGTSCTVAKAGATATVTCGTTSVQIADGTNGTNGVDGTSCTMANNADGTKTITCGTQSVTIAPSTVDYAAMTAQQKSDASFNVILTGFSVDASSGAGTVTFKVNDRYGNGVKKLWRNDATTTTLNTGMRFGLLQLVPGVNGSANDTWVSYNAAAPTGTAPNLVYSTGSAESAGTSATSKPVVDNGDGTYSYTFYRTIDVKAPAVPVVAYDASKLHRFVFILSGSGNPFAPVNVTRDFLPSAGITDTSKDGSADVFDPKSCLECHGQFRADAVRAGDPASLISAAFHSGARYDPRICVACHNDQRRFATYATTDAAGTTIDSSAIPASGTWLGNLGKINGEAYINMPVFIHKIHYGENLGLRGGPYTAIDPRDVTYPQDARNCTKCHRTVAKADNWKAAPSRRACGACHDTTWFGPSATKPAYMTMHTGGARADDLACAACHAAADVPGYHVAVAPPAADNCFILDNATGCNNNTNAASLAAAGAVPAGATVVSYDVSSVSTWSDTSVTPAVNRPQIVFKLKKTVGGVTSDVDFGTYAAGTNEELIPGFVGGPSAYFAWALPQDGISAPADFNASASIWLKSCWRAAVNCNLTRDATSGYYTLQVKNAVVAASATMLTGGIGYTYGLQTTQPLTQIDLGSFPAVNTNVTAGSVNFGTSSSQTCTVAAPCVVKTGGLIVPALDIWKTATGFAARRAIVTTAKCDACHAFLGANPTFHAGQRNDGPTCSFCHNPNRTSSGWSANAKDFVHGIHGAAKRQTRFTWHAAVQPDLTFQDFGDVTYPGVLNLCTQCHVDGAFDLSAAPSAAAVPSMLPSTVGSGRYLNSPTGNPTGYWAISPYVAGDNLTDYGWGYSTSNVTRTLPDGLSGTQGATTCTPAAPCTCTAANPCSVTVGTSYAFYNTTSTVKSDGTGTPTCTDAAPCTCVTSPATGAKTSCTATFATCSTTAPCEAQGTTLIKTPIVSACSACHDTPAAIDHMRANGGAFYESRAAYRARFTEEQCLLCHGPGKVVDISVAHLGK